MRDNVDSEQFEESWAGNIDVYDGTYDISNDNDVPKSFVQGSGSQEMIDA